jgi:hypothetical protein
MVASDTMVAKRRSIAKPLSYLFVIASAAKQSIVPQKERMDCFAALAMTAIQGRTSV